VQTVHASTAPSADAGLAGLVERWELGMERVATYKLGGDLRIHICRTREGNYWVFAYFTIGYPDTTWQVSADAANVTAEQAMRAVERRVS
jgi:hypothetical protein